MSELSTPRTSKRPSIQTGSAGTGKTPLVVVGKALKVARIRLDTFFSTLWMRFWLRMNGVRVGRRLRAIGFSLRDVRIQVSIGGRASIGDSAYIRTGVWCTEIGRSGTRILVGKRGTLSVGNRVWMSNPSIVAHESVTIGDDTFLGGGTQIFDTNFHSTDPAVRASRKETPDMVRTAPVTIGKRVFIGADVIVCKGVTIGDEAMVAAGSVVVNDVPSGEVWGGNPARRLR